MEIADNLTRSVRFQKSLKGADVTIYSCSTCNADRRVRILAGFCTGIVLTNVLDTVFFAVVLFLFFKRIFFFFWL